MAKLGSESEWRNELATLSARRNDPGLTMQEIADALHIPLYKARDLVRWAHRNGRLKSGRRESRGVDQRLIHVPVYTILSRKRRAT